MCFTESQSYVNTALLVAGGVYVFPCPRLSLMMFFLAAKDLIQGLLYHYQDNLPMERVLVSMSWIHICFQPLFVNVFLSYFSRNRKTYWNLIFAACIIYGLYTVTTLNEFDIQNDSDCVKTYAQNDFCSKETTSYIGKYHVAYKFSRDADPLWWWGYTVLMFLPSLFTRSRPLGIVWIVFVGLVYGVGHALLGGSLGDGEVAAMWCFSSIILALPVAVFAKQINRWLPGKRKK